MFKSVEYVGFESNTELRAKAEQLTSVLANEIRRWREDVQVGWSPQRDSFNGALNLTLSLTLPNGISGTHTETFIHGDFREDWLQRSRCRRAWDGLLGILLEKQQVRTQEYLSEPVEV